MKTRSLVPLALALGVLGARPAHADGITVRVMPPDRAQLLAMQRFDLRVEATATNASDQVRTLKVTLDGVDVTARGVLDPAGASNVRGWTFRNAALGITGPRVVAATATGVAGATPIDGAGSNTLTVRPWPMPRSVAASTALDAGPPFAARRGDDDATPVADRLHLGGSDAAFQRAAAEPLPKAKNVILLIGDGMGIAHRTAARVMGKGYKQGKANGTLAMDRFPFNGMLMTSSLNSLITDSAPGAHNYSTGNKTNNGMEGVFPDNTPDDEDNPRVENLSELLTRTYGKVTGIVSDAFITDATPAAFLAHIQDRGNGTLIASQYFDARDQTNLKVLLGGGSYHFIPKSRTGSRRTDERDVLADFRGAGYAFVDTATSLRAYAPGANARLLGLFNLDNMNVAFDKLKLGDPSVLGTFTDQPFLKDMASKAIDVLKQYPQGFFLMVEGAHVDKQAHRMDAERSIYDVLQLDQAVEVALEFARQTNTDADPDNDTLVLVSADHECSGMVLPGVSRPDKKGTRDYVKTYNYTDGTNRNDSKTANFTTYVDADGDGYPDSPEPSRKLIVNFGAAPDHFDDWQANALPKDPAVVTGGVAVANPADPDRTGSGALMLTGMIENGASGGSAEVQAVHTMSDIPISAYGPGASQFARVTDNTEAFFSIVAAITGTYAVPVQF